MTYHVNFNTPSNKRNVKTLWDYIWYHYSNLPVDVFGYILIMILACVCLGKLIQRNGNTCDLKCILSLLSSYACRGNFSKDSECSGPIVGVKPSRLLDIHSQKPRKPFWMLRKIPRHPWLERRLSMHFKSYIFQFCRINVPYASTNQDHNQNRNQQRQRTGLNNDTRYSIANFWYLIFSGP